MDKAFSAKQTETDQTQATPAQQPTNPKQPIQRAADPGRLPFYAQAWGNRPPPGLRLGAPEQAPHEEEPLQKQAEPLQRKENHTGLPDSLKTGVETLSGMSLDDVHVHYNSAKPAELQALAYTQGTEIHVGSGQEQHLAHEAWHVVQQKQGRVQATLQMKGVAINDDEGLEREADILGKQAVVQTLQGGATFHPTYSSVRRTSEATMSSSSRHALPETQWVRLMLSNRVNSQKQLTIQAMLGVQIIPGDGADDDKIARVLVGGRSEKPFSNTQGAHATAWQAIIDALDTELYGLTIPKAITKMLEIVEQDKASESLRFFGDLDPIHQKALIKAYQEMQGLEAVVTKAKPHVQALRLQELIGAYLTFINYLPGTTILATDTTGENEGYWIGILLEYETSRTIKKPKKSKYDKITLPLCLWKLFDYVAVEEEANVDQKALKSRISYESIEFTESQQEEIDEGADYESVFFSESQQGLLEEMQGVEKYDKEKRYQEVWITRLRFHLDRMSKAYPVSYKASQIDTLDGIFEFLTNTTNIGFKESVDMKKTLAKTIAKAVLA